MSTILILGLKVPFRDLWTKVGAQERLSCNCPVTSAEFSYCPFCGTRKVIKKIKVYASKLTGEETTFRNINSLNDFLRENDIDIYETNPHGYTDDPVYIYLTQPMCFLTVKGDDPVNMAAVNHETHLLEELLRTILGDDLWNKGEFGLWAFNINSEPTSESSETITAPPPLASRRTIIFPFDPIINDD